MSNKISLANKYRPKTFEDVVEQDSIKTVLSNQIKSDNLKHAYLFCGGAGTGKAQPLDSLVLTTTGYKRMGDINVGDKVIDGTGNSTIVTDIFPQGIKPVYKVEFSDRTCVFCSDEHLWKVGEYDNHKKQVVWSVKTINQMLQYGIRKKHSTNSTRLRYRLPLPVIDCWKDETLLIDPYVLGVLIGDGCLTGNSARFANMEQDIIDKVQERLKSSGFELHKINQQDKTRCNTYNIVPINFTYTNQYHKTRFINLLMKLNLCVRSAEKHIPKEYLYASVKTRIDLLNGLFDTDGFIDSRKSRGICVFNTSSSQLSEDFAFLVRSLGGTDTVVKRPAGYKKDNTYIKCNDTYEHTIKLPDDILPFSSEKHTKKYVKPQNGPIRKIVNIEYVGNQECQCIKVSSDDHTYITDNVTVTHNTTTARIVANLMNENMARPIELDCASHNGVDDMRLIIEECKSQPLQGKYKIFVLDECMTPDTEILTDKGYKQFKDLNHTEKVAQYNDDGSIEFVKPRRYIEQDYVGYLECWQPRRGHKIRMTPNHQQPLIYNKSKNIESKSICDIKFSKTNSLILSGKGNGTKKELTTMDKLVILCHIKGEIQYEMDTYNKWSVSLNKCKYVNKLLDLLNQNNIKYNKIKDSKNKTKVFMFSMPKNVTKGLNTYFNLDFSYDGAREFIDEIKYWNKKWFNNYVKYSSIEKENTDFVSAIATLAGYSAKQTTQVDDRKSSYKDVHRLWLYKKSSRCCQYIQKYREKEYYEGKVYCVEVPSHKIVVRANGYTFITGNCHMLTVQAWNSLLKILEEPPAYVIFLFCTTDPQKIIQTVLSRVQRFNFQRISNESIIKRLKFIIDQENDDYFNDSSVGSDEFCERQQALGMGATYLDYTEEAIAYIARLAKGGMRDSITTLEKCIDYSTNITLENVIKVTSGGVNERDLIELTDYLLNRNCKGAILYFNQLYMKGIDLSLFIKLYIEFLQNCVKYIITGVANITTLSDIGIQWSHNHISYLNEIYRMLDSLAVIKSVYNIEDLKILIESWFMKICS